MYAALLPEETDLAAALTERLTKHNHEAIELTLRFNDVTRKVREKYPQEVIVFNIDDNVCFPFFVEFVWNNIDQKGKDLIKDEFGADDCGQLVDVLRSSRDMRNRFRNKVSSNLHQEDLFALNEVISLQCFSSGGEYSFLKLVYPRLRELEGRVLDAGCGAGFASLVMGQYFQVDSIDASRHRVERAASLARMMEEGDRHIFPQVIELIQTELGEMLHDVEFPSVDQLLSGGYRGIKFHCGSLDNLPHPDQTFDAINCLDVLEHTYDPDCIIEQYYRVCKPGAQVFITVPTSYGAVEQKWHEINDGSIFPAMLHMHHWTPDSIEEMFTRHGFHSVEIKPFDMMPWGWFEDICHSVGEDSELLNNPMEEVPLQIFAVFQR